MQKIVFSSDSLPAHLSDRDRFRLWRDMWMEQLGAAEIRHAEDKPFATATKMRFLGDLRVGLFETTTEYYVRTRKHVANDRDEIFVGFYRSPKPQLWSVADCDLSLQRGNAIAYNIAQPCSSFTDGVTSWVLASVPRTWLLRQVPHADDRPATRLDPANPAVRHLERTIDFLIHADEVDEEQALSRQAGTALADLIVLALGGNGEVAEIAASRGLRAARLREAIVVIEARFADPALSTDMVARAVGLSRRYLNTLLLESGRTFAERVLELRLQKACAMLSDIRNDAMKVSDIALAAGFNDVSYFNRRFRARFGASPTQYRGG
ncbi:helix-turn-helix domain-containing protein [Mesorhizobium sp. WSM4906]|uniref:helix-turn-helix domain-containing protein n=1 Tax=Mesorhizobium sp. WSM4906 TaxID=3038546 RepID=UPI0024166FD5|nr:helix-turn-helix domain-containing protein [Mesorhizobium sp. WSM4906]WFP76465.1 helix-turn-helix domain-containing protein [Mesorhizobium sp. WSM4906]